MSEELLKEENTLPVEEQHEAVVPAESVTQEQAAPAPEDVSVESVEETEAITPVATREEVIARLQEMVSDISLAHRLIGGANSPLNNSLRGVEF